MPLLGWCGLCRYFPSKPLQRNLPFQLLITLILSFPSSLNTIHWQIFPRATDTLALYLVMQKKQGKGHLSYLAWRIGEWQLPERKFRDRARDMASATSSRDDALLSRRQKGWKGQKKHGNQTAEDESWFLSGEQWYTLLRYASKIMMNRPFRQCAEKILSTLQTIHQGCSMRPEDKVNKE